MCFISYLSSTDIEWSVRGLTIVGNLHFRALIGIWQRLIDLDMSVASIAVCDPDAEPVNGSCNNLARVPNWFKMSASVAELCLDLIPHTVEVGSFFFVNFLAS